jgi:putative Flp pilus-assembly TadE/G-like protein
MLRRLSPQEQQYGQAMVFVVLFLGVVTLSLVFLYKAGKITSEKMQLQNAADAAAYSVSIAEARDLNFMAYTNRAMVANEVAIGQLVGMASWATHWESFGSYLLAYHRLFIQPLISAASLGTATGPVETVFQTVARVGFQVPGKFFFKVFKIIGNIGATVLHTINKVYGVVQTGYHYASILMGISAYIDVVSDNAPNAKISDFGMMALIAHTLTYTDIIPGYDSFIKTYKPTKAEMADGFERFAAVVNGSRDEFSRHRGWTLPLEIPPVFPINLDYTGDDRFEIDIGIGDLFLELLFQFELDLEREGGSELRYVGDTATGTEFNWSAADTTELALTFAFEIEAGFEPIVGPTVSGGIAIGLANGEASGALTIPVAGEIFSFTLPFPTGAPFSSGAAQIGKTKLNTTNLSFVSTDSYGNSPTNRASWLIGVPFIPSPGPVFVAPSVPVVSLTMPTTQRRINKSYKGLPMYNDNILKDNPWGIEAPYFLAGVVIDAEDIYRDTAPLKTVGPNATPGSLIQEDTNFFFLDDTKIARKRLGAIAKSEVYFSRPLDLAYFSRADDAEEYGSAFNPYWQARLVQTTNADRVLSIALQQHQTFGILDQIEDLITTLTSIPADPTDWFP